MFNLDSITRGSGLRPPRIILLGVEKIGKSTFAAESDSPIFIPIKGEEGIDLLTNPETREPINVDRFPTVRSWNDLMECFCTLYQDKHDYRTVVIDSASALEPTVVWKETCRRDGNAGSIEKVGGGYSKGYTEALYLWQEFTEGIDFLRDKRNMACIIIGHVKVKRFDDPTATNGYDTYQFDINDKAACLLYRWADCILFANRKVTIRDEKLGFHKDNVKHRGIDTTGDARFLYTQKRPAHPGGGRTPYGYLPYELPLSWQHFIDAVSSVSQVK